MFYGVIALEQRSFIQTLKQDSSTDENQDGDMLPQIEQVD